MLEFLKVGLAVWEKAKDVLTGTVQGRVDTATDRVKRSILECVRSQKMQETIAEMSSETEKLFFKLANRWEEDVRATLSEFLR